MTKLWLKQKHEFKKTDNIFLKTQHFLHTKFSSIEDHNPTKQSFQTRILHKKRYSKPSNKYPYKILKGFIQNFIQIFIPKFLTYPYLDFFFFSSLLFSSLLFSLNRFALTKEKKKRIPLKAMFGFIQFFQIFSLFVFWSFFSFYSQFNLSKSYFDI